MSIRMVMIGAISRLVIFPVQHKYIRRASPLCVHKFLQIIDLQNYCPAFHSWKNPPEHVRIAINGRPDAHTLYIILQKSQFCKPAP
jgi:hypothetical protein